MRDHLSFGKLVQRNLALLGTALTILSITPTIATADTNALQAIKDRGTLRVGIMVDWPPYASSNARNEPEGYDADVAKLLADHLGLQLEYVVMTGPNRIPFLLTDKADVLIASLAITPERKQQVDFSRPYSGASMVLLGPTKVSIESPQDFLKYSIGVPRASTTDIGVSKIAPEGTRLRRFDDDASALQAMLVGQIDAAGTSSVIAANTQKRFPGKYKVQYIINEQAMGITVQKNRPELLQALNEFIALNIANGTLNALFEKRISMPLPTSVTAP